MAAEQFIVIEHVLPSDGPVFHGPGSQEDCEALKAELDGRQQPKAVVQADATVVPLVPLVPIG